MSSIRFGLYALAAGVAVLIFGGAIGHSQAPSLDVFPSNITAIERGMAPLPVAAQGPRRTPAMRTGDRLGRSGTPYAAGRVIVKFREGMSVPARTAASSQVSRTARVAPHQASADFDIVSIDPSEDAEAVARAFAGRSDVEYAQAAYRVHAMALPTFVPNDTYYSAYQWNFPLVDLERAWGLQQGGSASITAAVVDTGMAFYSGTIARHVNAFCGDPSLTLAQCPNSEQYPDLGVLSLPFARAPDLATDGSRFVSPADFIWGSGDPRPATFHDDPTFQPVDLDGHGTHVASTIGELTNNNFLLAGIAFNVKLMPVKVIDSDWDDIFVSPFQGTDEVVALGVRWAADHGANVINMSIGRSGTAGDAPVIESAIKYAVGKGCFIAIAAGNDGTSLPAGQVEVLAEIASRVQGAVSVAAVDSNRNHASYSTTGPYVELAAPGGDGNPNDLKSYVWQETLSPDYASTFEFQLKDYVAPRFDVFGGIPYQGTSMATPHVTGLAALLMAQGIKDPATIEAVLEHFATDLGTPGKDNLYGYGLISARNTLRGLGLAQ